MWIPSHRRFLAISLSAALLGGGAGGLLGICGPFTDVAADAFCPFVLEVFYLGITTGTTPTTYDPASAVSRLQMAAFLSRTVDGVVRRTNRRAALNRFWTQRAPINFQSVGASPALIQSDGTDVWVAVGGVNQVQRRRAVDGRLLETFTGATGASALCILNGFVFVTGKTSPGRLFNIISYNSGGGAVTTVATDLGGNPTSIAYDGIRLFTANAGPPGSLSMVTLSGFPLPVTTVTAGFTAPQGIVYDGANMWVTDGNLLKVDPNGAVLQAVTVGSVPFFPMYDGTNIWVPNAVSNSISIVRPSSGAVVATLTGNGLSFPVSAAFDGERVLVTNASGDSVSLWRAAGLAPIGTFSYTPPGIAPFGACSDGISFWVTLNGSSEIFQF